ncbi:MULTISPECIES: aminomethyl-transferring glycine dehydrogenase subunit GcvPB [unclassified Clostridioides]|uniref:aminomethyl-transferring glycine dehydrogenase subunit GcvPB n=1 Tax=unclassified Clostridioides TaxID=2635829 RepID=UPI001D115633|nr:aminomethyl-transferring glycine dehydrogenase subunit GcvPB [Clostridioides sp. ZZV14-6150]MCC0668377.1 aminomethyl-transferring glycine dehydrogenase subunit GcvPB [Clostridioides sp. ZZV14-6153]MCC0719630.1 aminomethyl-transferring glycine dehydrogenase subunit GcvPB [Clostridioides sp. ZZV14-6105]MCC0722201.1 aminomethyl-transferring glycine dehydrogenase subunit GcvPB [Clostridioides sp. ZZV14-6104]MCC0725050.1 aminomethyl-transferring glycine dehydrogenase subunit GcvPB [Clostridioides
MKEYNSLLIDISKKGRKAYSIPELDIDDIKIEDMIDPSMARQNELNLPEVGELELVRHYTLLSNKNFGVDTGFYPLGSCTMKYNPKINEDMAALPNFTGMHPYQSPDTAQGSLALMYDLSNKLAEITGMDEVTLQPSAGSHGEFTGLMLIKAYHENRGDYKRTKVIIPDSAHGTNPASAAMANFDVIQITSDKNGAVDIDALKEVLNDEVAALMLTNPSTLGLFEKNIKEIADLVHEAGGLLYYDGANMNAIMGITRPGDMGFDVVHLNLHKTFSTPHGGGGPGAGPVGAKKELVSFLPIPVIEKQEDKYVLNYDRPKSIGKIKNFYGNFGVLVRAYTYILTMGRDGLKETSEMAVLNANYIKESIKDDYILPIDILCKHEFVLGGLPRGEANIKTIDIAKRLLDYGYHPPTMYFPLIINEALMIEPTESESIETLDSFIEAMKNVAKEAKEEPELLKTAPHNTLVKRVDDARAVKKPILTWSQR